MVAEELAVVAQLLSRVLKQGLVDQRVSIDILVSVDSDAAT